ncbi:hypothetical protein LguiA_030704 [Lonicera macranthoides]
MVPFIYLKTLLAAIICNSVGFDMYLLAKLTAYIKSSLVAVKNIRQPISCLYTVSSTRTPLSSLKSLQPGTIGL